MYDGGGRGDYDEGYGARYGRDWAGGYWGSGHGAGDVHNHLKVR
jgi:hypothetical protein